MTNRFCRNRVRDDEGASLVLALLFIVVVGLFATAALNRSGATLASGQSLRERGVLQYALDGGVERALQRLQADVQASTPSKCTSPSGTPYSETVDINGKQVTWTCSVQAGRTKGDDDGPSRGYSLVLTSTGADSLVTQGGGQSSVSGSVFVSGPVDNTDLSPNLIVRGGDFVATCPATFFSTLTDIDFVDLAGRTGSKQCVSQNAGQIRPTVVVAAAPAAGAAGLAPAARLVTVGANQCQVYYPGRYTAPPALPNRANYFVSGRYYFDFSTVTPASQRVWTINGNATTVIGGQPGAGDPASAVPAGACAGMTDASAMNALPAVGRPATFANGVTWVFGGDSKILIRTAQVELFSPPAVGASPAANIVAYGSATNGYAALTSTGALLDGLSNNSRLYVNASVYTPSAALRLDATGNGTIIRIRGGVTASTVLLLASSVGSGGLDLSTPPGPVIMPPGFRTVTITSTVPGTSDTNVAVATISNVAPYAVSVKSWRTD